VTIRDPEFCGWLVSSLRSGLLAIDRAGRVVGWNAEASRILASGEPGDAEPARDPADRLGRSLDEVLAGHPALVRLLREALEGHERPTRAELALASGAEGPPRTIGFTLVPVRDAAGELRGAAMLFRDLTPFERAGEQERLRERLAALGEMAAGLAHELRNPLAAMEVLGGLLRRRLAGRQEECGLVDEILGEIRTLGATVSACLEFVKPPAPAPVRVDPVALLEESLALGLARVPLPCTVERAFEAAPARVSADAEMLRAVLVNLITNALEAMQESAVAGGAGGGVPTGRLALSVGVREGDAPVRVLRVGGVRPEPRAPAGRELVIAVSDSGPGVPPELRERIFYPFFTTREQGSGVGLALAQKLVSAHGGSLELESEPGRGATFRVRLPLDASGEGPAS
jgi:signal transduction histidine kinase